MLGKMSEAFSGPVMSGKKIQENATVELERTSTQWYGTLCDLREMWCNHPEKLVQDTKDQIIMSEEFLIGKGSPGTKVYVGIITNDGRGVAVKRVERQDSRVEKEVNALVKLDNLPNIVHYMVPVIHTNTFSYITLELCDYTLEEWLEMEVVKNISKENWRVKAVQLIADLLRGLRHMHAENMMHRDIKPQNLFVVKSRAREMSLKIGDFGLSRRLESTHNAVYSKVAGTDHWIAKEVLVQKDVLEDSKPKDTKSKIRYTQSGDIQVAGMVCHYIITRGEHPYAPGGKYSQVTDRVKRGNPDYSYIEEDPEACELIKSMLADDPEKRPSAEELQRLLFFWSDSDRFDFIVAVADEDEVEKSYKEPHKNSDFVMELEKTKSCVFPNKNNWESLSIVPLYRAEGKRWHKQYALEITGSVCKVIRKMRNIRSHYNDQPQTVKDELKGDTFSYFNRELPNLVLETYRVVKRCSDEERKKKLLSQFPKATAPSKVCDNFTCDTQMFNTESTASERINDTCDSNEKDTIGDLNDILSLQIEKLGKRMEQFEGKLTDVVTMTKTNKADISKLKQLITKEHSTDKVQELQAKHIPEREGSKSQACQDSPRSENADKMFLVGEKVRVISDKTKLIEQQTEFGGWDEKMEKYLGKNGTIKRRLQNLIEVQFSDGETWNFNKTLLQPCTRQTEQDDMDSQPFKRYDIVTIMKDKEKVMKLQEDHGGWKPNMIWVLGLNGVVDRVQDDGDVVVECNNTKQCFNPKLLEIVDTSHIPIQVGDYVLVTASITKLKPLQDDNHGGWNEKMQTTLGSTGTVVGTLRNGCVRVFISGCQWIYNLDALQHINRSGSPASNIIPAYETPSSVIDSKTDVLFYKRPDRPQAASGSKLHIRDNQSWIFTEGEKVRVDSDEVVAMQLQKEIGGWSDDLKMYLGKTGTIRSEQGALVEVTFPDYETRFFNKQLLEICVNEDDRDKPFKRYDVVSIESDKSRAKRLEKGHGGWGDHMTSVLGSRGYVLKVDRDNDVYVKCINQSKFLFNPKLLTVVDTSQTAIEIGDFVRVIDSFTTIQALQDVHHGGWQEKMWETLGTIGTVLDVQPNGCAKVVTSGKTWIYNVEALRHIARSDIGPISNTTTSGDTSSSDSDSEMGSVHQLQKLQELLRKLKSAVDSSDDDDDNDDDDDSDDDDNMEQKFLRGDQVRVDDDMSKAIRLQNGHGGWISKMKEYLGREGTVKRNQMNSVVVVFPDGQQWAYHEDLLRKCETTSKKTQKEHRLQRFKRYDIVVVERNKDKVMSLQPGHGGWESSLVAVLGKSGIVNRIDDDGDVYIEFQDEDNHWFNPKLLTVVDTTQVKLQTGDFVLLLDSHRKVKALQDVEHGGWKDEIRKCLGKGGLVIGVLSKGRVRVLMGSRSWVFNVKALRFISRSGVEGVPGMSTTS